MLTAFHIEQTYGFLQHLYFNYGIWWKQEFDLNGL